MERLKEILAQEDTVLFIGSGISVWSGLPTWTGLVEQLADYLERNGADGALVRSEAAKGNLLLAASYGFDKLTKNQIGEFMREACLYGKVEPQDIHRLIVNLGPKCFVTTNYDDLIEQSLRKWQPEHFFPPSVTNRHLTEMADVVAARAANFVFKPHGDLGDLESIILTREQYRALLPQGDRHRALDALKTLMVSRPIVYFGFGLQDPDFYYLRDILDNTYKGSQRDHYAVMADCSAGEVEYWRRNYGIHLVCYETVANPDGSRDHVGLVELLESLQASSKEEAPSAQFNPEDPAIVLSIARYAARLEQGPSLDEEFEIHVRYRSKPDRRYRALDWDEFDFATVDTLLDEGPQRVLLTGLPGAGKSYAIHQAVSRYASEAHSRCLSDDAHIASTVIPIFADLKLYRGSLEDIIVQGLPQSLPLRELAKHFKLKLFLDSHNEMPQEYLESGRFETDLRHILQALGDIAVVIGSRTSDGLRELSLREYELDYIDREEIESRLEELGIELDGSFALELLNRLQTPFFFQYVADGTVVLPSAARPSDFYRLMLEKVQHRFNQRFEANLDLARALSLVAYDMLNEGEEALPLNRLLLVLDIELSNVNVDSISSIDIANWLVSANMLIPYTGSRIAFVHQSITEYLAATELARRYEHSPYVLEDALALRRWDQALFLALTMLPDALAKKMLRRVIEWDLQLAINAARYLEPPQEDVLTEILQAISLRLSEDLADDYPYFDLMDALESMVGLSDVHEPILEELVSTGGFVGAAARSILYELHKISLNEDPVSLLAERMEDYNYCSQLGRYLAPYATRNDVARVYSLAHQVQQTMDANVTSPRADEESLLGFASGAGHFLSGLGLSTIRQELALLDASATESTLLAEILCHVLLDHRDHFAVSEKIEFAIELFRGGNDCAIFSLHLLTMWPREENKLLLTTLSDLEILRLRQVMIEPEHSQSKWATHLLLEILRAQPGAIKLIREDFERLSRLGGAILQYHATHGESELVFDALQELCDSEDPSIDARSLDLMYSLDLSWSGREELLLCLLKLRNIHLALALFGHVLPEDPELLLGFRDMGGIAIGSVSYWLEWMEELWASDDAWHAHQIGSFVCYFGDGESRKSLLDEFNSPMSSHREVLLFCVLPYIGNVTVEDLSDSAIDYLLASLLSGELSDTAFDFLAVAATEDFMEQRIIPIISSAEPDLRREYRPLIDKIGSRHGRRYMITSVP